MMTTKISAKGQLVIPKEVRKKFNIEPGTFFQIRIEKDNIVLIPMKKGPLDNLYGKFAGENILAGLEREHADEISGENRDR
jgi:AbrB family looped-hinge helix DNA binding protein